MLQLRLCGSQGSQIHHRVRSCLNTSSLLACLRILLSSEWPLGIHHGLSLITRHTTQAKAFPPEPGFPSQGLSTPTHLPHPGAPTQMQGQQTRRFHQVRYQGGSSVTITNVTPPPKLNAATTILVAVNQLQARTEFTVTATVTTRWRRRRSFCLGAAVNRWRDPQRRTNVRNTHTRGEREKR